MSGGITPPFLTSDLFVSGQLQDPAAITLEKESPVAIGCEVGWAPESVWKLQTIEKICAFGNRTPAVQPVACLYTG
jgi:hypothetical protein